MGRTSDANLRLMNAAIDLIWEESYGTVTIDDICKRADVRKGSFYYYFDSKASLAVAALNRLWEEDWHPALEQEFAPAVAPLDRLRGYFEGFYARSVAQKARYGKVLGCPLCTVGSEVSTHEAAVSAKVREIFTRKHAYFENAIRDAVAAGEIEACDPTQKTRALIGLIEGLVSQSRIMNNPDVVRELPAMAISLLRPTADVSAHAAR